MTDKERVFIVTLYYGQLKECLDLLRAIYEVMYLSCNTIDEIVRLNRNYDFFEAKLKNYFIDKINNETSN